MFFPTSPSPPRGMIFNFPCLTILVCFFPHLFNKIYFIRLWRLKSLSCYTKKCPADEDSSGAVSCHTCNCLYLVLFQGSCKTTKKAVKVNFQTQFSIAGERRFVKARNVNVFVNIFSLNKVPRPLLGCAACPLVRFYCFLHKSQNWFLSFIG